MAITLRDIATLGIGTLSIILVVLTVIYIINDKSNKEEQKDTFTMAPNGVTVTPTGALSGPAIYTNHLTNGDSKQLLAQAEKGVLNDTSCAVIGDMNNIPAFDGAMQKQLKVQEIQSRAKDGFQQVDALKEISTNIAQDNSIGGVFKRTGMNKEKLVIDKYSTVGVIDQKYMPNRDRPKELRVVGTAICVPGFDFDATKSLASPNQGICPTGGVKPIHMERHKHKTTNLQTVTNFGGTRATTPKDLPSQLSDSGIMSATTISPVNQEQELAQPQESAPIIEEPAN